MRTRFVCWILVVLLASITYGNNATSNTTKASKSEHAKADENLVEVSVISNETTEEKKKKEATNETVNSKEEKSKELKKTTIKIGSEDESNPLNVTKNETNSIPKIDFDYEKFMKELKASHDKLSKLNEALKMNKKIVPSISSDDEKQPESESEIKKAQKLEKNVNESSEKNLASSSIKGNSDKNNKSSTFNTAQVKKGNYESTKDFVIVPQTLVNDYQKNMELEEKQKNLTNRIEELTKLLASVEKLSKPSMSNTISKDLKKETSILNHENNIKLLYKNIDKLMAASPRRMKQPNQRPENEPERPIIPPRIIGDDDHNQKHLVLAPLSFKEGNQKMLNAEKVQEMMKNHYSTYHDNKDILKNQDEEDAKEKPWKKNQNNDQDLKERINHKLHPGYVQINKPAASNEEPGLLHSIGNFFGAVGRGVSNAANWMWEAIKAPFSK